MAPWQLQPCQIRRYHFNDKGLKPRLKEDCEGSVTRATDSTDRARTKRARGRARMFGNILNSMRSRQRYPCAAGAEPVHWLSEGLFIRKMIRNIGAQNRDLVRQMIPCPICINE